MDKFDNLPDRVIGLALKDVTGASYDMTKVEEREQAIVKIESLLCREDHNYAEDLATSIARHSSPAGATNESLPRVMLNLVDGPLLPAAELQEDLPSRAEGKPKTNVFISYSLSPEHLGFETPKARGEVHPPHHAWKRWKNFFTLAEKSIPQENWLIRVADFFHDRKVLSCEHKASNYELVKIKNDEQITTVHFLIVSDCLYFVAQKKEDAEPYRAIVSIDEPNLFAKDILQAFNGENASAKLALASVQGSIIHH